MLWLAGLMGILGAGAASVVVTQLDIDEPDDDEANTYEPEETHGDLMDEIAGFTGGASTQLDTLVSDLDALGDLQDRDFLTGAANPDLFDENFDELYGDGLFDAEEPSPPFDAAGYTPSPLPHDAMSFEDPAEQIRLGDWITEGKAAEVVDYDAGTESLVLVWDDLEGPATEPQVRVETDPFDDEVMHVMMNDTSVAEVYGDPDLTSGDITMIPLSSALIVGLEPA